MHENRISTKKATKIKFKSMSLPRLTYVQKTGHIRCFKIYDDINRNLEQETFYNTI